MVRFVQMVSAAAAVAFVLAGCGSENGAVQDSASSSPPSSAAAETSTPAAAASEQDEQEIKDLLQAQADAFAASDWDALAQLTCAKYRDQAADPWSYLVPPISSFGTREELTAMDVGRLSGLLGEQFGGAASPATLDRVAQALVAYDEPAYRVSMLELMTESATLTIDKVENIVITGDTATADVTVVRVMGDQPPDSSTESTPFAKEDGRWLDCTDLSGNPGS